MRVILNGELRKRSWTIKRQYSRDGYAVFCIIVMDMIYRYHCFDSEDTLGNFGQEIYCSFDYRNLYCIS